MKENALTTPTWPARPRVAEGTREMRLEPFRIVAGDVRGRAGHVGVVKAFSFIVAQRRGPIIRAVGERGDGLAVEAALSLKHAEQNGARRVGAHQIRARRPPTQRVVDQPRDGGAIAGAGEAMA